MTNPSLKFSYQGKRPLFTDILFVVLCLWVPVWGTKPELPSITQQPKSITVGAFESANFVVQAESNLQPIYYQWLQSLDSGQTWQIVDGETEKKISVTWTGQDTKGRWFRAIVSNNSGSTITESAQLLAASFSPVLVKFRGCPS